MTTPFAKAGGVSIKPGQLQLQLQWAVSIVAILAVMFVVTGVLAWVCHSELRRRFKAEAVIRHREEELRLITDHATDVIVRLNASMIRRFVSPSSQAVFGCSPDQLVGHDFRETMYPKDRDATMAVVEEARRTHGRSSAVYRIVRQDGELIWVEGQFSVMPDEEGFAVLLRDITARKAIERDLAEAHEELRQAAATDSLTGLSNRRRFDETISQEWRRAAREKKPVTLLLLDIDYFKRFNDHYGHQGGDACLRSVAQVGVHPFGWTKSGCCFDRLLGVLILELHGAEIAQGRVQPS